ncbi:MAG: GCN5-related N-acetyltransferase [Pseudonocardiales bacterium]|nr:GCN5-related N-acetyltransferase [Jatrophihabitantaceae bacterium]MCW2604584.1 GCN5-related N-acetyltransferase [Pseudonocardiales bacterium]
MPRGHIRVRVASASDLPAILNLVRDTRQLVPHAIAGVHVRRAEPAMVSRYETLLDDENRTLFLALDDEEQLLGMAVASVEELSATVALPAVHVSNLVVGARHRRRGVGRVLISSIVRYAEAHGVDHIVAGVISEDRETHRYLARLGFAPMVVRRVAPTATVRRALGLGETLHDRRLVPGAARRVRRPIGSPRVLRRGA